MRINENGFDQTTVGPVDFHMGSKPDAALMLDSAPMD